MFKKIINFTKNNSLAGIYLLIFILTQTIVNIGLLFYKVINDYEFGNKFLELLGPIYLSPDYNYFKDFDDVTLIMFELMQDLLTPTLIISNVLIVLVILSILIKNKIKNNENLIKKINITKTINYISIGIFLNLLISIIISLLPKNLLESYNQTLNYSLSGNFLILFISAGIMAPLSEELVFRYGMMKHLNKINKNFALIYQALLFGLLHGNIIQITYAFILGVIFGIINNKEDNIMPSIIIHISINTSSVLISSFAINEFIGLFIMLLISIIINCILMLFNNKLLKR